MIEFNPTNSSNKTHFPGKKDVVAKLAAPPVLFRILNFNAFQNSSLSSSPVNRARWMMILPDTDRPFYIRRFRSKPDFNEENNRTERQVEYLRSNLIDTIRSEIDGPNLMKVS